jgi:hypothetical protein
MAVTRLTGEIDSRRAIVRILTVRRGEFKRPAVTYGMFAGYMAEIQPEVTSAEGTVHR